MSSCEVCLRDPIIRNAEDLGFATGDRIQKFSILHQLDTADAESKNTFAFNTIAGRWWSIELPLLGGLGNDPPHVAPDSPSAHGIRTIALA